MRNEPSSERPDVEPDGRVERIFQGLAVAGGVAIGHAMVGHDGTLPAPVYAIAVDGVDDEVQRFRDAVAYAIRQVRKLKTKSLALPGAAAEDLGYLLDARLQMLSGSRLVRGTEERIRTENINAEAAVHAEVTAIAAGFQRMGDTYLAQRADDIREVGDRLIRNLLKEPFHAYQNLPNGAVLVAHDLTPADTVLLDPAKVAGFATVSGGPESHTAIVARSLGIPAVLGVADIVSQVEPGDLIVVDGDTGRIVLHPSAETLATYGQRQDEIAAETKRLRALRRLPAVTRDGVQISLQANLELPRDIAGALDAGAEGIGLFRTEFMFMNRDTAPSEDEQYAMLRDIVAGMSPRPVTIRTLDVGGDKLAPSLREQLGEPGKPGANPALGVRGIRLSLAHPKLLETQLAAILRASAHGPVRILLPMISTVEEIREVREVMVAVAHRLRRRREPFSGELPPLGVMIEVPGAALSADALATEADFFSLGTNDLTMYTLAIDRGDERVAALYNPIHPGVLRLIQFTIEAGLRARKPVAICGEIAGDPRMTALLVGLGARDLSMAATKLPRIKERIRTLDLVAAAQRARTVMDQWDGAHIAALMDDFNASLDRTTVKATV